MRWITNGIRQSTAPRNIKRGASKYADTIYDRKMNPVAWWDVWSAYVAGATCNNIR